MKKTRFISLAAYPFLFLLEYILKFTAGVTGVVVLGAPGSFFGKLGTGFTSITEVFYRITSWPDQAVYLGNVIRDYNSLTASTFNQKYGGDAINQLMEYLNGAVAYVQSVYENIVGQPFATVSATLLVFLFFYILGRILRFIRQRGRGSYIIRKEREIGDRIFRSSEE